MTDLLERPAPDLLEPTRLLDPSGPPSRAELGCPPHQHTDRCWWHPHGATWVCPPGGRT